MSNTMKDLAAAATAHVAHMNPAVPLAAQQQRDLILNMHEPAELEYEGAVIGALHIPRGILESKSDASTGKGKAALVATQEANGRVHLLCASGARETLAVDTVRGLGYDATAIKGGIGNWKATGLPAAS